MPYRIRDILKSKRVVLASASPRRKELMRLFADDFEIVPANGEENVPNGTKAEEVPIILAEKKCREVTERIDTYDNTIVIGCDTVVICDGIVLGKPKDEANALSMLTMLSGTVHHVVSGICVYYKGEYYTDSASSQVEFFEARWDELAEYVASGEPMDKAGAYAIQGLGGLFVKRIEGDYNNIVGLPTAALSQILIKITAKE